MKKSGMINTAIVLVFIVVAALGCNFSTVNMSSLKTFTDEAGKTEATNFKAGDTIYGKAQISNNPGKVTVKMSLAADDAKGMTKGETIKGSEVTVNLDGDGVAIYTLPIPSSAPAGTYNFNADLINEAGEKKDGKTTALSITAGR